MKTYNQLIHEYRKIFKEKELPPETVKAFLFELCNDHKINLYLDIDKPMDEEVYQLFVSGMERIMNISLPPDRVSLPDRSGRPEADRSPHRREICTLFRPPVSDVLLSSRHR